MIYTGLLPPCDAADLLAGDNMTGCTIALKAFSAQSSMAQAYPMLQTSKIMWHRLSDPEAFMARVLLCISSTFVRMPMLLAALSGNEPAIVSAL